MLRVLCIIDFMKIDEFYKMIQDDEREKCGCTSTKKDFIIQEIGSGKKVLDIGCNDGKLGEKLLKNNNIVYGCDIVPETLEASRKKGLITKLVDIEKESLPYPKNFFDYIILADVIEHIFDTDRLIRECYKTLKPNGKLILTTPNVASFARRLMLLLGISPYLEYSLYLECNSLPPVGHIRYFTVSTLKKLLNENGFNPLRVNGDGLQLPYLPRINFFGKIFPSVCSMIYAVAQKNNSIGKIKVFQIKDAKFLFQ